MRLYVFRHGAAERTSPGGDPGRRLVPKGREKTYCVAQFVKKKINPEVIISSPYIRAVETARVIADAIGFRKKIEEAQCLTPGSDILDTIAELQAYKEDEILIVGHNPHLSELISELVSNGSLRFDMKKAALAAIDFDESIRQGNGYLLWILTSGLCE